jgi:DNA-binding MarR family transcriptional regulator
VDRLCKRGLTKRIRSQTDRRVVQVEITKKGLELLDDLDPHVQRLPPTLLGHMSQANLQQLSRLLGEVLEGMGTFT